MARVAKVIKSTKPLASARKSERPSTTAANKPTKAAKSAGSRPPAAVAAPIDKRKPGRPAKTTGRALSKSTPATKAAVRAPTAPPAQKVSKDELRAQVEKLEQLAATLRARSRETNKAAKAATARIAELEAQVADLEKKIAPAPTPVSQGQPERPALTKRQGRGISSRAAVARRVAVDEPASPDEAAEAALENPE